MPTVYILRAPSPDPKDRRQSLPVGCVLREGGRERAFFLIRPESIVWQEIVQQQPDPGQWTAIKERLPGYEVAEYQDERDFEVAFNMWQAYIPLAWESRGEIPPPLTGRGIK